MNKKKLILTIVALLFTTCLIIAYSFYSKIYTSNTTKDQSVYIPTDSSFKEVISLLDPILNNKNSFEWVAEKKNYPNTIKAGKYDLQKGMNNNEIVNLLRSGNQTPIKVSFNNQDTLEKLAGRIAEQIEADSLLLLNAFNDLDFLQKSNINKAHALSIYIPNSYEFYWNTSATKFRDRMLREFNKFWTDEKIALAKKQKLTHLQVISLASIVQKETATISERPMVAGLYLNRYHHRWPLQADPTIIYALKQKMGQDVVIKRVLLKDLEIKSDYNTYKNIGIPPGPIAMPDISSINAVLNPSKHNYYYMCADVENPGKHLFAKTLAQHNRNAVKYQQWVSKQGINR